MVQFLQVQVGLVNAELRVNPLVLELRAEVASLRQATEHLRVGRDSVHAYEALAQAHLFSPTTAVRPCTSVFRVELSLCTQSMSL